MFSRKIKITPVRRSLSKKEKREAEKQRKRLDGSPILFLLYLGGIISMMYVFVESQMLNFGYFLIAAVFTSLLSTALWYVYFYQSKYFIYLVIGFCLLALLLGAWQIPQMARLFKRTVAGQSSSLPIMTVVLFVVAAVFILFALEFVLRRHSVLFLLAGALVIAGPLIELKAGFVTIIIILLFQFSFFVLNMTRTNPRREFSMKNRAAVSNASAVVLAALLLIAFIPAVIIQKFYEEPLFLGVYQADAVIKDTADKLMGNYGNSDINGNVSRGNLRQTGETAFVLQTREMPENKMYFRTFTGENYFGDYWSDNFGFFHKPEEIDLGQKDQQTQGYRYGEDVTDDSYDENTDEDIRDEEDHYDEYHDNEEWLYTDQLSIDVMTEISQSYKNSIYKFLMYFLQSITPEMVFRIYTGNDMINVEIYDGDHKQILNAVIYFTSELYLSDDTDTVINGDFMWLRLSVIDNSRYAFDDNYSWSNYYPPTEEAIKTAEKYLRKTPKASKYVIENDFSDSSADKTSRYYLFDLAKNSDLKAIKNIPTIITSEKSSDYANDIIYALSQDDAHPNDFRIIPGDGAQMVSTPYFCRSTQGQILSRKDNEFQIIDGRYSYNNAFIDEGKITAADKWDDHPNYRYAVQLYSENAKNYYTYYDTSALPRLTELCRNQLMTKPELETDLNTVTTFIAYTLQNYAEYSVNPGSTPWNKDPAEYFLFDNHKGFCVHYATVAANMYRMLGIPARYAAGYVVDPAFMHEMEKDNDFYKYENTVTDYTAHAWVEIFLEDYGWVAADFTPDEFNRMHVRFPGYDEDVMNRIMRENGWSFRNSSGGAAAGADGGAADFGGLAVGNSMTGWIMIIILLSAAVLFLIAALIRRAVIIARAPSESCCRAFDRMIRAVHYAGLLSGMNGSEPGFEEAFAGCLDCVDMDRSKELLDIMQRHCFSDQKATDSETELIRAIRKDVNSELYERLPLRKKLIFKYWKALI